MTKRKEPVYELIIGQELIEEFEREAAEAKQRFDAIMAAVPDDPDSVEAAFIANFDKIFGAPK